MAARNSKRSAIIVSAAVMGSRVMGVVREQVFAFMFGASELSDVFVAAFRIPNLLRDLFAEGALSTAFTATFTKMWTKEGPEASWRLAQIVLSTLILVLGLICLLGIAAAPWVVNLTSYGFHGDNDAKYWMCVSMTRLLFPFILFVSIAALAMGMLNARNIFGLPASASTIFNIVSVVFGMLFAWLAEPNQNWNHPRFGEPALYGWCFGVLLGGLAQLAVQLPALWGLGFRFKWKLNFADPALRTVMMIMIPSVIAGSAVQINVVVSGQFASQVNGAVSWLYYAFRLVQLPIGIFGVAIATVTLPAVARQHALDDLTAFGRTVEEALRFGFYLTLPASVGLAVVAYPVIQLVYQHGNFTSAMTAQTALALQAYTISIAGYSGAKILVPCFYAMAPPRFGAAEKPGVWAGFIHFVRTVVLFTPARVSLTGIALNLVLCFVLYDYLHLGHVGLALTTGLIAVMNFLQLLYAIQKKIAIGDPMEWLFFFARVTVATLVLGVIVFLGDHYLLATRTTHSLVGAVILFANIGVAGAAYFLVTVALRVPESMELVTFVRRKFGGKNVTR